MDASAKAKEEERFRAVLLRLLTEVFWIRTYAKALRGLVGIETEGFDFFVVARSAMVGDRNARLLRVVDDHDDSRPLIYLRNCRPKLFDRHLELGAVEAMQERLKEIRDRVVAHIDRRAAGRAAEVYENAGVKMREVDEFVENLWDGLRAMHEESIGAPFEYDELDGGEPQRLARLRDAARRG